MQTGDDILFTAPGPDFGTIPTATTEIVGTPGNALNVYWIVTHFPIGSVLSGPFPQKGSPNVLDDENYILISWLPAPGASSYDLLVTKELQLPKQPGRFLLATLTETEFRDRGETLDFYDVGGIPLGAPQEEHVYFNNRDFKQPTLQFIPWPIQVSSIIFEDGSEQTTAGGGGGGAGNPAPPNQSVQFNDNGIFGGSPYLIFNQNDFPPLGRLQAINPFAGIVANFSSFGIEFTGVPSFAFINLNTSGSWSMRSGGSTEINCDSGLFVTAGFTMDIRIGGTVSIVSAGPLFLTGDSTDIILQGSFQNLGNVGIGDFQNVPPFNTTYKLDVKGDINIIDPGGVNGFTYRINGVPFGGGGGAGQTPWLSNIDADFHALNNISNINASIFPSPGDLSIDADNGTISMTANNYFFLQGGLELDISAAGNAVSMRMLYAPGPPFFGYVTRFFPNLDVRYLVQANQLFILGNQVGSRSPININNLPTDATNLQSGDVWNNAGILNIV